jgi:hypothetical protein
MAPLLALLLVAALAPTAPTLAGLVCSDVSSVSLRVDWPPVADTDLYYVELHRVNNTDPASHLAKPLALVTSQTTAALLQDLVPNTTYWLRVRSHPASAPSIVWGWRAENSSGSGPLQPCTTRPSPQGAPHSIARTDAQPSSSSIALRWELPRAGASAAALEVQHAHLGARRTAPVLKLHPRLLAGAAAGDAGDLWEDSTGALEPGTRAHTLAGLRPGSAYAVRVCARYNDVRGDLEGAGSRVCADPMVFHTRGTNTTFTEMVRVSEYINEVDFLPNHNSADLYGQVAFLTNTNDDLFFNVTQNPPVTFYCVEHVDPALVGGWADYISCNGPEADPYNSPEDPICICDVWPDRMIGLQTKAVMDAACGPITWAGDTHDSPPCNCTDAHGNTTKWVVSEKSRRYPGIIPTYLPFFYFQVPADTYPGAQQIGWFYSTPANGTCASDAQPLGTGDADCTWRAEPLSRMVYAAGQWGVCVPLTRRAHTNGTHTHTHTHTITHTHTHTHTQSHTIAQSHAQSQT